MPELIISPQLSHDTISALEQLLEGARAGDVVGIAYTALLKRRRYLTDAAGECFRDPTFARGLVAALDDHLSSMVHHRAQDTHI